MSIYKHIEQGVMTDHFVLSSMDYPIMTSTEISIFDIYPFLEPTFATLFVVAFSIWIGLLISVFQARSSPHKFISIQLNIVIILLRILCVVLCLVLATEIAELLAWKYIRAAYFFIFVFFCLYIKRKETLVKAGFFIITEFLKFTSVFLLSCLSFSLIREILYGDIWSSSIFRDRSLDAVLHGDHKLNTILISLALFLFLPALISILFRWDTATYRNTISLKHIFLTCIGVYIIIAFPYTLEWIDWK